MPHDNYSGRTAQVGAVVHAAVQPGAFSAADKREQMAACRHQVSGSSGLRCASATKVSKMSYVPIIVRYRLGEAVLVRKRESRAIHLRDKLITNCRSKEFHILWASEEKKRSPIGTTRKTQRWPEITGSMDSISSSSARFQYIDVVYLVRLDRQVTVLSLQN